jgi:chromosome partitioning protein
MYCALTEYLGESAVRKILIASQKSGVGKSTTSMNLAAAAASKGTRVLLFDADPLSNVSEALKLAEHPRRQILRHNGIELPGMLVDNLVPGLDVLCPYGGEHCPDADFERLLRALATPALQQFHGCLIVDVPPFMGGNAAQLLALCDEFLLVMRAEAMAYRTLPALLELVQRSSRDGLAPPMRGILLTLPQGEQPGCRWERELRGRFGARALAEVIPYDEHIREALQVGQIGCHLYADSPAAQQYHRLVETLGLSNETCPPFELEIMLAGLRDAAATIGKSSDPPPQPAVEPNPVASEASLDMPRFVPPPEPIVAVAPSSHRVRRLNRSGESPRPKRSERSLPPPAPVATAIPPEQPPANALAQFWPLWILLGVILGGGIRFVPPSASLLPFVVGAGVTLLVVVLLFSLAARERKTTEVLEGAEKKQRSREVKKLKSKVSSDAKTSRLSTFSDAMSSRRSDSGIN